MQLYQLAVVNLKRCHLIWQRTVPLSYLIQYENVNKHIKVKNRKEMEARIL